MKLDYFLNHKYKPRKIWWPFSMTKEEQGMLMARLAEQPEDVSPEFAALSLTEKDLHKHTVVERFGFDLRAYLERGELPEHGQSSRSTLLIVYYPPEGAGTPQYYMIS